MTLVKSKHPERQRRSQAERSATTRGALVQAARELFARDGYAATGREAIVERAGVTRGALYHHFADKEALFRAVFEGLEAEVMAKAAMDSGALLPQPLEPLTHLLLAALHEAALYVARAGDQAAARAEVGVTVANLLDGLRSPAAR
jgi:AcrR family transcriptional regulator